MPNHPDFLREGQGIGPYVLTRLLGSGSFGVVWEATGPGVLATTRVALKFPKTHEFDRQAFAREARAWARVGGHPNIATITDANVYDGLPVIASEYVEGGSLSDWVKQNGGKAPSLEAAIDVILGLFRLFVRCFDMAVSLIG